MKTDDDDDDFRTQFAEVYYDITKPHKNGVGTLFPDLKLVESTSPYPGHELGLPNIDPNNDKGSY